MIQYLRDKVNQNTYWQEVGDEEWWAEVEVQTMFLGYKLLIPETLLYLCLAVWRPALRLPYLLDRLGIPGNWGTSSDALALSIMWAVCNLLISYLLFLLVAHVLHDPRRWWVRAIGLPLFALPFLGLGWLVLPLAVLGFLVPFIV